MMPFHTPNALTVDRVEAPLRHDRMKVRPEWIDRNGHMGVRSYAEALAVGSGAFLRFVGLSFDDMAVNGSSTYARQWNLHFIREVRGDATLRFETQLLGYTDKALNTITFLYNADEDYLAATGEFLDLHISVETRRPAPMSPEQLRILARVWQTHKDLPRPPQAGGEIRLKGNLNPSG
jgi:acyl-CoA thioester hydrolase